MAQRNLDFSPDVMNVVAEAPDRTLEAIASVGAQLAETSAKAKILAASAQVQTEFKKLDSDFRLQNADDPTNAEALKGLSEQRQQVVDSFGKNIPLLWRRDWNTQASDMALQSSLNNDLWGVEQQRKNVVTNVNTAKDYYLMAAQTDGMAFGHDDKAVLSNTLTYLDARGRMEGMATSVLGPQGTRELLDSFDGDYVKMFISGLTQTNPVKALSLIDREEIKSTMKADEYLKFRTAIENRALNAGEISKQQEVLNVLKTDQAAFSSGKAMSYAEIQQLGGKMSEPAREYFMKVNGYSSAHGGGAGDGGTDAEGLPKQGKLKPDEKFQYKAALYDRLTKMTAQDNVSPEDLHALQSDIFNGMRYNAITQEEGAQYISQILTPVISQKEQQLEQYSTGQWNPFSTDTGFITLKDFFEKKIEIKPPEGEDTVGSLSKAINASNKVKLYDTYLASLQRQAAAANVKVADIPALKNSKEIYATAEKEAKQTALSISSPVSKVQPEIPMMAIKKLLAHPEKASDFDAMFGVGAANRVLGANSIDKMKKVGK